MQSYTGFLYTGFVSDGNCDLHLSRRTTNAHSRRLGEMLVPGIIWHVSFWKNLRRLLKYITINPKSFVLIGYFFPSQKNPRKNRFFEASKAGSPLKWKPKYVQIIKSPALSISVRYMKCWTTVKFLSPIGQERLINIYLIILK